MLGVPATVTIDEAFEAFLADQRERLSPKTLRNYEDVVHLLRDSLNSYASDSLSKDEQKRWRTAFDAGDEEGYCISSARRRSSITSASSSAGSWCAR
jgi:hypothetical protein